VSGNFFDAVHAALVAAKAEKLEAVERIFAGLKSGSFSFTETTPPETFARPSYASFCTVVSPFEVQKRTNLATNAGKAVFLHAIAHIEYSAIDLALDAAYRFRELPPEFYADWLEVADDEVRHFRLLESLLAKTGHAYGDFPVHNALFEAACKSPTLISRMAAVPRYLEAGGLDANPRMMERLRRVGDDFSGEIVAALEVILNEEIGHVKKGDRWFKWACEKEGRDESIYFDLIEQVLPGSSKKKAFLNAPARLEAGFSCTELRRLSGDEGICS
jgi:uncharacterized ferritin-like protein (DUF455 family)